MSTRRSTSRRPRLAAAFAAVMVVGVTPAAAQAQEVVPAVVVTDDGTLARGHEAASVLIDRDDPDTIYLANVEMFTGACQFHASTDGGASWSAREIPVYDGFTDCGLGPAGPKNVRTELRQSPDGTLYYLHHGNEPGGSRSVLLGRSNDGGNSWETTAIHEAARARTKADIELNFLAHLAIDPEDPQHLVATWRRSYPRPAEGDGKPTRPWMAVSTDGGETWGEPRLMFEDDIGFDGPRPLIVDGSIYAFHRVRPGKDAPEDAPNEVAVSISADGGETWDRTVIRSADDVSEPVPAHDGDAFYAVWHDNTNGHLDAFFSRSEDGTTWSEPVRLNDDPTEPTTGQYYPQMTLSPDGRIDVAWYDYRDDTYPQPSSDDGPLNLFSNMGKQQSVYLTSSDDGGRSWTPNRRVNDVRIDRTIGLWDPNFFFQVPLALAAWDDGTLVAWSDTRNGDALTSTQDIVTARLAASGQESQWSWFLFGALAGGALGAGFAAVLMVSMLRRRRRVAEPALA